jgi:hypothetical protein
MVTRRRRRKSGNASRRARSGVSRETIIPSIVPLEAHQRIAPSGTTSLRAALAKGVAAEQKGRQRAAATP